MTTEYWYEQHVHFGDVDLGGGLYHPRYFDYFDRARIAALEELGSPFDAMLKAGAALVVASANIDYKKPVGFGQKVGISTSVARVSNKSFVCLQTLTADPTSRIIADERVYARLEIVLVHVDLVRRVTTPLPPDLAERLRASV
jgi:acyl-CoA thioester hydrolase